MLFRFFYKPENLSYGLLVEYDKTIEFDSCKICGKILDDICTFTASYNLFTVLMIVAYN